MSERHFTIYLCQCGCGRAAPIAKETVRRDGYVKGQPMRFIKGHNGRGEALSLERRRAISAALTVHGHASHGSPSRTYQSWRAMVRRCTNELSPDWRYYGGRGITVCDRWRSFENFLADMGERPEGKTLDRLDNDGDYEPENCRWATAIEQRRNRRVA